MKIFHKKALTERSDDVAAPAPSLLSEPTEDGPRLKPHALRMKDGMLVVDGTPHLMHCALARVVLKGPHYMLSPGEVQPLVGPRVRCDCGSVAHDARRGR